MKRQSEWRCWLRHPLRSPLEGVTERQRGGGRSAAAKVVIRGEAGGGGGEISAHERRPAFNGEEIKEVGRERRGDVAARASTQKRSKEDGRTGEEGGGGFFCVSTWKCWRKDEPGLCLHA